MHVDVAIVGGGPAGCSAALTLLECGLSVAVFSVDSKREKPTETSAPTLKAQLSSLGADAALDGCWPCYGIESNWGRDASHGLPSILNPRGNSWFIDRTAFDGVFKRLVKMKGAFWIDTRVHDVQFDDCCVHIDTQGKSHSAKFLIVANGSPFWSARITSQTTQILDSLVVFWASIPSKDTSLIFWLETADNGWWYVCPNKNQTVSVCLVTDGESVQMLRPNISANWNRMFEATKLKKQFKVEDSAFPLRTSIINQATLPQQVGDKWIAVGDAARKLDPLASVGIASSLASGQRAAKAVSEALQGHTKSLQSYQSGNDRLFSQFTFQRQQLYEIEARKRQNGFWSRRLVGTPTLFPAVVNDSHVFGTVS